MYTPLVFKRSTSLKTAANANIRPAKFSHSGARTGFPRSFRRRSCNSSAANPMAATTTSASGLKSALRLVYRTTTESASSRNAAGKTVQRRGLGPSIGLEAESANASCLHLYRAENRFSIQGERPGKFRSGHFERNDSINNVGSQARVDFGSANHQRARRKGAEHADYRV